MKWEDERRGRPLPPERETPRHRARKDRKRWCGGHVGREHVPAVTRSHLGEHRVARGEPACWNAGWRRTWWICTHQETCTRCGRVMRHLDGRECPDYVEPEEAP